MPKVSAIIPIYNGEKYLEECLNSVLNQSMKDIEIICVNDGSTDGTSQILERYATRYENIIVIEQENKGVVAARRAGVQKASGEYVGFVDCDDWIDPDMYYSLYSLAKNTSAEMISSGYYMEGGYTTTHFDNVEEGVYAGSRMNHLRNTAIYNLKMREVGIRGSLCNKLFLNSFFQNIDNQIPQELVLHEDKLCVILGVINAECVAIVHKAFYHYRLLQNSSIHGTKQDYLMRIHMVYQFLLQIYEHPNFTDEMRIQAELYLTEIIFKGINNLLGFRDSNMLRINPDWMEQIPSRSRVVLYGGGEFGEKYYTHIINNNNLCYVCTVDFEIERQSKSTLFSLKSPHKLDEMVYDYIVITIKNLNKAKSIKTQLMQIGVPEEKILWFRQDDVFWKYAEADGIVPEIEDELKII